MAEPESDPPAEAKRPESVTDIVLRAIAAESPLDLSLEVPPEAEVVTLSPAPTPPASLTQVAAEAGGAACELTGALQASLQTDPSVQEALERVPASSRSVANALLLWNGDWMDSGEMGGEAALAPIRDVVVAGVLSEPADCRSRTIQGPRFLSVTTSSGTALLVFGSGVWRWGDILGGQR